MAFGVTPEGFVRKTTQQILQEINDEQHATIDPNLDLSSDQPMGQVNGIMADKFGEIWEALDTLSHAFDPDAAEDQLLVNLGKLTGTARRAATQSTVDLDCELAEDTELVAGTHFAAIDGKEDVLWTPEEDFTAPSDGTHSVRFVSQETGPITASQNTITVISTAVVGWESVNNPDDASPGRNADTDAILRQRREEQLTAAGSATIDAVKADLLDIDDIETAAVFENTGTTIDAQGRPPGSIEAVLYDGTPPLVGDDVIAQAIWESKAGGAATFGESSGTATDSSGNEQTVNFTRVTVREVWLEFDVTVSGDYAGDAALKLHIATEGNKLDQGEDVIAWYMGTLPGAVQGVTNVTAVRLGFSVSPSGTDDLEIDFREIARFDTARIVVNS
jgi:hypothetical protein